MSPSNTAHTKASPHASPVTSEPLAAKGKSLTRVASGFDLACVRCAAEVDVAGKIHADEDFVARVQSFSDHTDAARIGSRLSLLTDCYRVDQAITPKLFRLGRLLRRVLRLVRPLDMFVLPSSEMNAFCIPSRKGNRFVMCLHSALVNAMSSHELLFVMGHEVGHALFRHGDMPGISFEHPDFSPLEVVRLRGLGRAKEISCDRIGFLTCQNLRVACTALFKLASGLSEKWVSFDETAYSRHFDELSSMAEVVNLEDASRTHPLTPLRVKALMAYAKSEPCSTAFERSRWTIASDELERGVETMLSVLSPDVSDLESKKEEEAGNEFLYTGALMVIAADGMVNPEEVGWLRKLTRQKKSAKQLAEDCCRPDFAEKALRRLSPVAAILRNKLSDKKRAGLLYAMCEVAACGGGIPEPEFKVLDRIRQLLDVPVEIAKHVLHSALNADDEAAPELNGAPAASVPAQGPESPDVLDEILDRSRLTVKARPSADEACRRIRAEGSSLTDALRKLVSWAIVASGNNGPLTEAQGKRLAISAIKTGRDILKREGKSRKSRGTPVDRLVRKSGVVAMFKRGERVTRTPNGKPWVVVSVSRTKGILRIVPEDNREAVEEVDPRELFKDPEKGAWPKELTDL